MPRLRRRRLSLAAATTILVLGPALVLTTSAPALADSYDAAIALGVAARDRALDSGSVADWEEAFARFTQAALLRPTKEAKFELAGAAVRLRLDDEAYAAYEEALALGLSGRAAERARAFLAQHELDVGRLAIAGPPGTAIAIGGRSRGQLPLAHPLVVLAGEVLVRLDTPLGRTWEARISVPAGSTTELRPELEGAPAAPAAPATPAAPASKSATATTAATATGADPAAPRPLHQAPAPDNRPSADALAGYIALVSAGLLVATGVAAWRVRERNIDIYNDDSICLRSITQNRAQQCGGYIDGANVAIGVEIAAFAAAGLATAIGTWWLLKPSPQAATPAQARAPTLWCAYAVSGTPGIACGGAF